MSLPTRFVPAILMLAVATPALAQNRGDFHWNGNVSSGGNVSVANISGNVRVTPSTTGQVVVTGIKRGNGRNIDLIRANVEQTSRGLMVCVLYEEQATSCNDRNGSRSDRNSRSWGNNNDWNNVSMDLEVAVPAALTVSATSVSGDVYVSGAQGDVEATSVSGDVRLDGIRATSIRANSVSGNIEAHVDQLSGRGDLSFTTVSGDVNLELPRAFEADLSMSTVSGELNSDYQMTVGNGRNMSRRSVNARIGNGGRRLDLQTVSGDVRLRMGSR